MDGLDAIITNGYNMFLEYALEARKPDPPWTVSQWSDKNRHLATVSSPEPGLWRTSRTPYLREIMDNLSVYSPIETTVVMKGAQIGMSEAGMNFCGYAIHHAPGPLLYVMPTVETVKKLSKTRLEPMIRNSPALSERIAPPRSRDSGNTMLSKEFDGGVLLLTGANSAAGLRSMPIRYLILDEVDAYPTNVDDEGDPVQLAIKRTANFIGRKIFLLSTPANQATSRINAEYNKGDKRLYHVGCEECGVLQPIVWASIKWPKGEPEKAVFVCRECGHEHPEHRKKHLMKEENGACWIATQESSRPNLRSYHISALYSPWFKWSECARDFLSARHDPALIQPFVNTVLGEVWSEREDEAIPPDTLHALREEYPILPPQTLALTCGVDVQPNRLELELVAWGAGEESWNIDYQVIEGDASGEEVWEQLDIYLKRFWPHPAFKNGFPISATSIDTGGLNTQSVYKYVAARERNYPIWGIKGNPGSKPVWPKAPSLNNKGGINLYIVGVDSAKEIITARLKKVGPNVSGPGACHFHMDRDLEYFAQLTSEYKVVRYHKGRKTVGWEKAAKDRNEALDCRVYAYAALQGLIALGLDLNRDAEKLENRLKEIDNSQRHSPINPAIVDKVSTKKQKNPYPSRVSSFMKNGGNRKNGRLY